MGCVPRLLAPERIAAHRLEVTNKVRILVNGKGIVAASVGKRTMHGKLYVATNQSVVWLKNLRVEALQ